MKIFSFLKWQWQRSDASTKIFMFSFVLFSIHFLLPIGLVRGMFMAAPFICMLVFGIKWFVWDRTIESYQKFMSEQNKLFDTIKNSDKK